jgi:hypothetical protein
MNKKLTKFLIVSSVLAFVLVSTGFAANYAGADNVAGHLMLLKATPAEIQLQTSNMDKLKYKWNEDTIFLDAENEEISAMEFFRKFKNNGVFLSLDGKLVKKIAPAEF